VNDERTTAVTFRAGCDLCREIDWNGIACVETESGLVRIDCPVDRYVEIGHQIVYQPVGLQRIADGLYRLTHVHDVRPRRKRLLREHVIPTGPHVDRERYRRFNRASSELQPPVAAQGIAAGL